MCTWNITTLDPPTLLSDGSAPTRRKAWRQAIDAALGHLATDSPAGCAMVVDGNPAVLIPGRTESGELDVPAMRAAAERMAIAVLGLD